jgi:drug/metabolite transporter (DMT)-like permease
MGIAAALGNIAQGLAFELLHAGVAATFIQMNILFVALLSVIWLGEALDLGTVLGMALALAGVFVTQWSSLSGHFEWSVGVFWAVLAAFGFSCIDALSRRYAQGVDAVVTNVGRAGIGTLLLACLPGALHQFLSMEVSQIAALALAAILGPGVGRLLLISASRELPAAESALIQQLRPPLALPLTSLVFGVWPTEWEWWGSMLVAAGVVVPLSVAMRRRES